MRPGALETRVWPIGPDACYFLAHIPSGNGHALRGGRGYGLAPFVQGRLPFFLAEMETRKTHGRIGLSAFDARGLFCLAWEFLRNGAMSNVHELVRCRGKFLRVPCRTLLAITKAHFSRGWLIHTHQYEIRYR